MCYLVRLDKLEQTTMSLIIRKKVNKQANFDEIWKQGTEKENGRG